MSGLRRISFATRCRPPGANSVRTVRAARHSPGWPEANRHSLCGLSCRQSPALARPWLSRSCRCRDSCHHLLSWHVTAPRISRGRVEAGLVGLASTDRVMHRVVDFEYDALGAVVSVVRLLILAADDREGVHDVRHGVARDREGGFESRQVFSRFPFCRPPITVLFGWKVKVKKGSI